MPCHKFLLASNELLKLGNDFWSDLGTRPFLFPWSVFTQHLSDSWTFQKWCIYRSYFSPLVLEAVLNISCFVRWNGKQDPEVVQNYKVRMERLNLVQGPETMPRVSTAGGNAGSRELGGEAVGLPCCSKACPQLASPMNFFAAELSLNILYFPPILWSSSSWHI